MLIQVLLVVIWEHKDLHVPYTHKHAYMTLIKHVYTHMHTCMNKQTYTHMNIYNMHNLTNAYEHVYMNMYKHFYARTQQTCMHVHTCTHKHIHTYPFIFTDTHRGRQIKSSQKYWLYTKYQNNLAKNIY